MIVSAEEGPGTLEFSSVGALVPTGVESVIERGVERVVRSPARVSFFSSGLANSPPNVEPLVAVEVPVGAPSFSRRPQEDRTACSGGGSSVLLLFRLRNILVCGSSPPPAAPPVSPKEKPPVVWGTGVDVPDVSSFWVPNNPPPNVGVVVEVDVEVAPPSAGLGEAQGIHQSRGRVL